MKKDSARSLSPFSSFILPPSSFRPAFTLNELLIVVAIIILMLALALPAFNVLSGSKSIEGASNQIGAVLGQARVEAIGVQEVRGVMFFLDPATDRVNMAMVRATTTETADVPGITYLDLVPDRDFTALPAGVGVQTVDSAVVTASVRQDDGYIGYNTTVTGASSVTVVAQYGGVILFDAYGKIVSTQYGFRCSQSPVGASSTLTAMGSLLSSGNVSSTGAGPNATDCYVPGGTYSQLGIALYDRAAFKSIPTITATESDPQIAGGAYAGNEQKEESWLDGDGTLGVSAGPTLATNAGASVYLVNRYNGTLIKSE